MAQANASRGPPCSRGLRCSSTPDQSPEERDDLVNHEDQESDPEDDLMRAAIQVIESHGKSFLPRPGGERSSRAKE
jgi:hypothetical protein